MLTANKFTFGEVAASNRAPASLFVVSSVFKAP